MVVDREKTIRLLKEAILQLCRVSLMGSFEVDGIICISPNNSDEENQLVVKVHERVSEEALDGNDARDKKRLRDAQSSRTPMVKYNDHDDSLETTNETISTWKNSGSDANSWTSDFAGCISGRGWKQIDKMLTMPKKKLHRVPSRAHEEIQELSIKKTVRKIEDNFYFSCKQCAIAFSSKVALDNHMEQCAQRGLQYMCVDPLSETKYASFQQKIARKRKQRKPLRGFDEDLVNRRDSNDSNNRQSSNGFASNDKSHCGFDGRSEELDAIEREAVGRFSGELLESIHEKPNDSVQSANRGFVKHMKSEHGFSCHLCSIDFSDFPSCNNHFRTVHNIYACAYCPEKFSDQQDLGEHLAAHLENEAYDCLLCGLSLSRRSALVLHHQQVHGLSLDDSIGDLEEPFLGSKLDESLVGEKSTFMKPEDFVEQEQVDLSNFYDPGLDLVEDPGVPIQEIADQTDGRSGIPARRVMFHAKFQRSFDRRERMGFADDEKLYECDKCREHIRGTSTYQLHCKKIHHRTPCLHCGKTFSQKGNMERHMRLHTGVKPYRCHLCRRSFCRKEALLGHVSQDHATSVHGML